MSVTKFQVVNTSELQNLVASLSFPSLPSHIHLPPFSAPPPPLRPSSIRLQLWDIAGQVCNTCVFMRCCMLLLCMRRSSFSVFSVSRLRSDFGVMKKVFFVLCLILFRIVTSLSQGIIIAKLQELSLYSIRPRRARSQVY
jgi:hypothetical protein